MQIRERLNEQRAAAASLWGRVGPRTRDVIFILVALVTSINQIVMPQLDEGLIHNTLALVFAVVIGTASLWWRRAHPVALVVIGIVIIGLTAIYMFALIGLFSLAIRRRDRTLVILAMIGIVVSILGSTRPDRFSAGNTVATIAVILMSVLAGAYIGVRRDLLVSLRDQVTQAEAERDLRAAQARIAERSRIAREMHDVLAHKVSLIALHAGGLEVNSYAEPRAIEQAAHLIGLTARQALADLRGVLGVLRADESPEGSDLAPQPSIGDLPALIESSSQAGVRVELSISDGLDVPEVVGRTAYRIVQEALTNVHKHARRAATQVSVSGVQGTAVTVEVRNALPVSVDTLLPGAGAGLIGLRERVELLGGQFVSGETPEGGWLVKASIPWPKGSLSVDGRVVS
ncbi:sensor histidine kinase [Antricoccus suffuscus]|uniref:sensor histidine kinase n=1 Tax=Antricoccus suffuscus TaxID=1629062 RepID=UPI00192DE56D|nr:histidine kinase [Antricoccus suffuscus]